MQKYKILKIVDVAVHMCTCTHTCTHTCIQTCVQTCTHMHTHTYTFSGVHIHTYICTHAHTHTHIHTHIHTHTHTHTHAHTQAVAVVQRSMRGEDPAQLMHSLGFGPLLLISNFVVKMSGAVKMACAPRFEIAKSCSDFVVKMSNAITASAHHQRWYCAP